MGEGEEADDGSYRAGPVYGRGGGPWRGGGGGRGGAKRGGAEPARERPGGDPEAVGEGAAGRGPGGGGQRGVSEEIVCHSLEARRVVERGEGINQHIICVVIWGGRGEAAPEQQRQVQRRTLSSAPRRRAASWPADPA